MCGIAGVLSANHREIEPAVRRMMQAMIHRGPDDEGYEEVRLGTDGSGPVAGFGFRRLAILDLSPAGHQPMFNARTGDCLIFNGEIYNFRWLKSKLEAEGVSVQSSGDTEVLLKALSQWGERALDELDGMYAFAFYEAKSRRILLARDPLGIKPLYVSMLPRSLVFASEIRAVLASGLVPTDLDPAGIATFLAYGAPQDPLTVHRAVTSFPSGSCQWIDASITEGRQARSPRRYWRFPDAVAAYPESEAVWRIEDELQQSVREQCVADVPLGVFLSGGIDSATIAALASKNMPAINTFSVGFEGSGAFDETEQAAATAKALGTVHRQTFLDEDWITLQWPEWLKAADRPSIDGLNTFVVSGAVKSQGITVALSGLGADELFGGYPQFRLVPRMQRWLSPLAWMPPRLRRAAAGVALSGSRPGKRDRVMDLVAAKPDALGIALSIRRLLCNRELRTLGFSGPPPGLTAAYLPEQALSAIRATNGDAFRTISQAECHLYMGNTLLRDSDCYSMAHSLELRVPFLGRSVSEQAMSLPGSMHDSPASPNKHLLRKVAHDLLPDDVFNRPKQGFTLPVGDWMAGPLSAYCEAAVESLAACPLFDARGVHRLWEEYRANRATTHWTRPVSLVVLGSYLATVKAGR